MSARAPGLVSVAVGQCPPGGKEPTLFLDAPASSHYLGMLQGALVLHLQVFVLSGKAWEHAGNGDYLRDPVGVARPL